MLTNDELTAMRTELNRTLPDTCVISTVSFASDGAGEWIPTWTAAGTIACRLDPIRQTEMVSGGAIQPYSHYRLTLPYNAVITEKDRVRVGGVDYNVISLSAGSWKLDTRAEVEKV